MKKYFLTLALLSGICLGAIAADPVADSAATPKPKYWNNSLVTNIGFSQVSLTNWSAGGYGSLALNTYIDGNCNYTRGNLLWNNRLQLGYGFINNFGEGYKKSDDRIVVDSKFGYKAVEKLYFSAVYNFTTQFTTGYKSTKGTAVVSDFFAPAYTSLGLGIDYTPSKDFSINFAPLTGKVVMVKDEDLRPRYGNAADQFAKWELGAQVKIDGKIKVKDFSAQSTLTLFTDYLDMPLGIKVNWDVAMTAKLTQFLSATFRTYTIWDRNIKFLERKDKNGEVIVDEDGTAILYPGVQFKELFSLAFTYTFGGKKK